MTLLNKKQIFLKIKQFINNNKLYFFLIFCIFLINIYPLIQKNLINYKNKTENIEQNICHGKSIEFKAETEIERKERIIGLMRNNSSIYLFFMFFTFGFIILMILGIIIDVTIINKWVHKRSLNFLVDKNIDKSAWNIIDIFRLVTLFLFFGHLFSFLQILITKIFPILNNKNFLLVFNTCITNIITICIVFYFVIKKYNQKLLTIGLTCKKFFINVFLGIIGYIAILPILFLVIILVYFVTVLLKYEPPVQTIVQILFEEKQTSVLWFSIILASIFGPIAEEIFFRGCLYNAIKNKTGIFWAIIISSFIFSILHFHIVGFVSIFVLGIMLSYLYHKTGSIVSSITLHIFHNINMVIFALFVKMVSV